MKNGFALAAILFLSAILCSAQRGQMRPVAPSTDAQTGAGPITAGQITHQVLPKYPKEARASHVQGPVVLDLTIEPTGEVSGIGIASGDLELAEEAVDAVREWRFDPYTQQGKPVKVAQSVTFNFDPAKKEAELGPLPPATVPVPLGQSRPTGEGVFRPGHGVSAPRATYMPNPPFTEKARKAKYQGVCVLSLIVDADGTIRDVKVERALGEGLDIQAVDTVNQWRFEPAMKDDQPVAAAIMVEMNFNLY